MSARLEGKRQTLRELEEKEPAVSIVDAWDIYSESPERPETSAKYTEDCTARWMVFYEYMKAHHPDITELRQITREHAAEFMTEYGRTRSAYTYNLFRQTAIALWRFMADYPPAKLAQHSDCPFARIAKRRNLPTSKRALTADELTRVCRSVDGEMRVLFAIGLYTGLRLKDCALLKWENVDTLRRMITCTPAKTARIGKVVTIPIHPVLFEFLTETPEPKRRGFVLPGIATDYKDHTMLTSRIRRIFEDCGIETRTDCVNGRRRCVVGFHSLRHSFVSLAANAGAPLAVVQRIVGHSSRQMTDHYFHETTRAMNAAVALLPNVIDVAPNQDTEADRRLAAFREAADGLMPCDIKAAVEYLKAIESHHGAAISENRF